MFEKLFSIEKNDRIERLPHEYEHIKKKCDGKIPIPDFLTSSINTESSNEPKKNSGRAVKKSPKR